MPEPLSMRAFSRLAEDGVPILDIRPLAAYRHSHVPGALSLPYSGSGFLAQARDLLPPGSRCLVLDDIPLLTAAAVSALAEAGAVVMGWLEGGTRAWAAAGHDTAAMAEWTPSRLAEEIGQVELIDVREGWEVASGLIAGSRHIPLADLPHRVRELSADATYVMVCRTGARSSYAQSYLGRHRRRAINLEGGIVAWQEAGYQVVAPGSGEPEGSREEEGAER